MSIKSYLKNLLYQPRQLLSELQQLDQHQFQTAMKYLFNSKKEHLVSLPCEKEKLLSVVEINGKGQTGGPTVPLPGLDWVPALPLLLG